MIPLVARMPTPIPKVASSSLSPSDALYNQASFTLDAISSLNAGMANWLAFLGIFIALATSLAGAVVVYLFNRKLKQAESQYQGILELRLRDAHDQFETKNMQLQEDFTSRLEELLRTAFDSFEEVRQQQAEFSQDISEYFELYTEKLSDRFISLEQEQQERFEKLINALRGKSVELQEKLNSISADIEETKKKRAVSGDSKRASTSRVKMPESPEESTPKPAHTGQAPINIPNVSFYEFAKRISSSSMNNEKFENTRATTVDDFLRFMELKARNRKGDA